MSVMNSATDRTWCVGCGGLKAAALGLVLFGGGAALGGQEPDRGVAVPPRSQEDLAGRVQGLEAENARLRERIAELEQQLAALTRRAEDLSVETQQLTELAGLTAKGEVVASDQARFTEVTEADSDRAMMQSPTTSLQVTGEPGSHWMALRYPVEPLAAGAPARWVIETRYTSGRYEQLRAVVLEVEGREIHLPVLRYDRTQRRQRAASGQRAVFRYHEVLELALPQEVLRLLARQQAVSGRLGHAHLTLSREQVALLQAVQARIDRQEVAPAVTEPADDMAPAS